MCKLKNKYNLSATSFLPLKRSASKYRQDCFHVSMVFKCLDIINIFSWHNWNPQDFVWQAFEEFVSELNPMHQPAIYRVTFGRNFGDYAQNKVSNKSDSTLRNNLPFNRKQNSEDSMFWKVIWNESTRGSWLSPISYIVPNHLDILVFTHELEQLRCEQASYC